LGGSECLANTPPHYDRATITAVKGFQLQAQGAFTKNFLVLLFKVELIKPGFMVQVPGSLYDATFYNYILQLNDLKTRLLTLFISTQGKGNSQSGVPKVDPSVANCIKLFYAIGHRWL